MGKIIYMEDRINGLHCYTPEMGQRKPEVKMEAVKKARVTAARGCYKDQLDTITATESGIEYTYKTI